MLFELAKACLLTTYIYNKHGARATVTARLLKEILGNIMLSQEDQLLGQLDPEHIFHWRATDKISHYEHDHGLPVRENTICVSSIGQECVGIDVKRVCKNSLKKKFGQLNELSGSFDNERYVDPQLADEYPNSKLGNSRVTHEHMKEVIETISPTDALKLGQLSMFFMNVKERLYDRMCANAWKEGRETQLSKLLLVKNQTDLIRDQIIVAIPKEYWQQSQHLSHHR